VLGAELGASAKARSSRCTVRTVPEDDDAVDDIWIRPVDGRRDRFAGKSIKKTRAFRVARLGVAHVAEDHFLFAQLTVRENHRPARGSDVATVVNYFPRTRPAAQSTRWTALRR
jgi:ABC-type uncharacterized transport system ATPase subunit